MSPPLTPPGCDVRAFPYMPLEPRRLLDSDLFLLSTGDEFKAALALWCWSWTQVPAGSISSDERIHAKAAGIPLADWRLVSEMALRGWVECDDGRLYHPVVAEKCLRAWIERLKLKNRSAKGNAARYDTFTYSPQQHAARLSEAVAYLERLQPGSSVEFGVVLKGDQSPPERSAVLPEGTPTGRGSVSQPNLTRLNETDLEDKTLVSSPSEPTPAEQAFAEYLSVAEDLGLAQPRKLDADRAAKLTLRLSEHGGPEGWSSILDLIRRSPHLQGKNDRGWKATFDWLMSPANLRKVAEGNYVRDDVPRSGGGGSYLDIAMEGLAA